MNDNSVASIEKPNDRTLETQTLETPAPETHVQPSSQTDSNSIPTQITKEKTNAINALSGALVYLEERAKGNRPSWNGPRDELNKHVLAPLLGEATRSCSIS